MNSEMQKHMDKFKDIYAQGCLKPDIHYKLVMDLKKFSDMANVPERFIVKSAVKFCKMEEIEWAKSLQTNVQEGMYGLLFTDTCERVEDRMMGLAGMFIWNFIDARVYTVQFILDALKDGSDIDGRVIIIPNFYIRKGQGGGLPSWQISTLMGFILERYSKGLPTILYVQDLVGLKGEYGKSFVDHIEGHFLVLED